MLIICSGLYNEVVTVRVIPEEGDGDAKEFLIYRKLAAHYSTFFAEIFGENGPPKMKLDSVNTRIFELFVQFLNARRFEYRWRAWVDANQDPYFPLVKLYELAERLGAIALMNQVISKIRNVFQDSRFKLFVSISVINYIYEKTNKGAPLRRVVRDMFAFHSDTSTLKYSKTTPIHREFDSDLRTRLILRTQKPEVVEPADDQYHLDEIPEDEDECAIVENAQV